MIAELKNENERLKKEASCTFSDDCLRVRQLRADYKEACGHLQTANLIKDEQLAATRHSKRKRCLAMAKWCEERYNYLTCLENWQMTDKEYQQVIGDYWDRWNTRWLKIAEQFKEEK